VADTVEAGNALDVANSVRLESFPIKSKLKSTKLELETPVSYVDPYYAEVPELVFDGCNLVLRKTFAEKYSLCSKGAKPKRLMIGLHLKEEDVEKYFGPLINRNGYKFNYIEDEELIREVEHLGGSTLDPYTFDVTTQNL